MMVPGAVPPENFPYKHANRSEDTRIITNREKYSGKNFL